MVRQRVMITNPTGLHLRPAGIFCNTASSFKCKVTFEYDRKCEKCFECSWGVY